MFNGTLGNDTCTKYKTELLERAQPYHAKPFPMPKIYEEILKTKVNRLVNIWVLKYKNRSQWAAPTFIIPKKNGTVCFISDLRELNKRVKRKPLSIPKIQDLLLKLEGFKYASSLDLKMDYHIKSCSFSRKLCTMAFPWGKYEYQKLPIRLYNSLLYIHEQMNESFDGLEYVRT